MILRISKNFNKFIKRLIDIALSLLLAVILFPLFFFIYFALLFSGVNPIYKHQRIGQNFIRFNCLKFRTMHPNSKNILKVLLSSDPQLQKEWTESSKLRRDPRVTKLGVILRKFSLDELPQIFNVLLGSMSLVGPRPITDNELVLYGDSIKRYALVKPGLTGLWQVSGRSNTSFSRRVELDMQYIENWDVFLDFNILVKTPLVVLYGVGAY